MDHAPSNKEHIANAALGQGVGYGIVLGLGGAFALGTAAFPLLGPIGGPLMARQA
jgi:hypothetical protein